MKNYLLKILAVSFCLAGIGRAADVGVGDSPILEISTINGGVFRLSEHRGHVVALIFFSASTDAFATDIQEAINTYGPKGFDVVGICSTTSPRKVQTAVREHVIEFPVSVDPVHIVATRWGVSGTKVYLFNTQGKIIWIGTAKQLKKKLPDAMKEVQSPGGESAASAAPADATANQPDPNALLDQVESAIQKEDLANADKLLSSAPSAGGDEKTSARIKQLHEKLSGSADVMLASVDPLVTDEKYPEAIEKLQALSQLTDLPAAGKAKKQLLALQAKPEVKKQIEQAQLNDRANQALAAAEKLQTDKNDEAAYARFKSIVSDYPNTDASATAAEAVKDYEADKDFMKKLAAANSDSSKAKSALSLAESYRHSDKIDLAKAKYQEVIDQFPGTKEADAAKTALAQLSN